MAAVEDGNAEFSAHRRGADLPQLAGVAPAYESGGPPHPPPEALQDWLLSSKLKNPMTLRRPSFCGILRKSQKRKTYLIPKMRELTSIVLITEKAMTGTGEEVGAEAGVEVGEGVGVDSR